MTAATWVQMAEREGEIGQNLGLVQGSTNRRAAPGFVNFVPALAYHFCLNLAAAFTQPGTRLLVEPCMHGMTD